MARRRCARHLTTAAVVGCIPIPRRWEVGLFNEVTSKETEAAHFQRKLAGIAELALIEQLRAAEKAKEAEIYYVQGLYRQVHRRYRRKRQWKRQQEELRVSQ